MCDTVKVCSSSVGRILDLRLIGQCVVSLSKTLFPLHSTCSTKEDRKRSPNYD